MCAVNLCNLVLAGSQHYRPLGFQQKKTALNHEHIIETHLFFLFKLFSQKSRSAVLAADMLKAVNKLLQNRCVTERKKALGCQNANRIMMRQRYFQLQPILIQGNKPQRCEARRLQLLSSQDQLWLSVALRRFLMSVFEIFH